MRIACDATHLVGHQNLHLYISKHVLLLYGINTAIAREEVKNNLLYGVSKRFPCPFCDACAVRNNIHRYRRRVWPSLSFVNIRVEIYYYRCPLRSATAVVMVHAKDVRSSRF